MISSKKPKSSYSNTQNAGPSTIILVHPGSLIAAKAEVGFQDFEAIKQELLSVPPAARYLVTGGLIPEEEYPITRKMAQLAKETNPPVHAGPDGEELAAAAQRIWEFLPSSSRKKPILVTGAWADPNNGCATCIHEKLLQLGAISSLSEFSPIFDEDQETT